MESLPWATIWNVVKGVADTTGLIVAVLTLFIVLEMRRARSQAISPELIVLAPVHYYEFRWVPLETLQAVIRPELRQGQENQYETLLPVFRLKNIGSAPALNIKCYWSINGESIENIFMSSSAFKDFSPKINEGLFYLSLRTSDGTLREHGARCSDSATTEVAYCIASPTTELVDVLPMPYEIASSVELRLAGGERSDIIKHILGPSLEIAIGYADIDGREHKRRFLIESKLLFIPDTVGSTSNAVAEEHKHPVNIRGSVKFSVRPYQKRENNKA